MLNTYLHMLIIMQLDISGNKDSIKKLKCHLKDGKDSLKIMMVVHLWNVMFTNLLIMAT
jgi:hypothetical protein